MSKERWQAVLDVAGVVAGTGVMVAGSVLAVSGAFHRALIESPQSFVPEAIEEANESSAELEMIGGMALTVSGIVLVSKIAGDAAVRV